MNMRLLGAPTVQDVVPSMVDASNIHSHIVSVPEDRLYGQNCEFCCYASLSSRLTIKYAEDETMQHAQMRAQELKAKAKL